MSAFRFRLLGRISLQKNGQPLHDLPAKSLELLCFLLLHRDRPHTREALSEMLWPGASDSQSKKYLRQTLWQLQSELEGHVSCKQGAVEPLLCLDPGWVCINAKADWQLDVDTFERAHAQCQETPDRELTQLQAQQLEEAISLYHGDLIETWYQDWCIYERERLQLIYLAMLEKLMGYCEAHLLYARGIAYGQRILRRDPSHESTHRQVMRLYCKSGDRTAAMRQYDRCCAALAKEFKLQCSRETKILYEQIRTESLDDAMPTQRVQLQPPHALQPDINLQQRLGQALGHLSALQQQIQQALVTVGQVLSASLQAPPNESKTSEQTPRQTR